MVKTTFGFRVPYRNKKLVPFSIKSIIIGPDGSITKNQDSAMSMVSASPSRVQRFRQGDSATRPYVSADRCRVEGNFDESSAVVCGNAATCIRWRSFFYLDNKPVDVVRIPFGVRTIRFDAEKGFFLNGKSVKIQGTCNHQDFIGVGTAMPDSVLYWRVEEVEGDGLQRDSHVAQPARHRVSGRLRQVGVSWSWTRTGTLGDTQNPKTGKGTGTADLSDLREMILRDRNHPSIIMWSMCNEEPLQGSADGKRIFAAMMDEVHKWDTTRPITCAMNGGWGSGISDVEDLQGINYAPGAYDGFHQKFPTKPLYGSETASTVSARGNYEWEHWDRFYGNREKAFVNAYDVNAPGWAQTAEDAWRPIAERPYVAGGYVWTGFDYKGRADAVRLAGHQQQLRPPRHVRLSQGRLLLLSVRLGRQADGRTFCRTGTGRAKKDSRFASGRTERRPNRADR